MKILLQEICHRINQSQTKILTDADRIAVHTRYRAILEAGRQELPALPPPPKGKRGRVVQSDA